MSFDSLQSAATRIAGALAPASEPARDPLGRFMPSSGTPAQPTLPMGASAPQPSPEEAPPAEPPSEPQPTPETAPTEGETPPEGEAPPAEGEAGIETLDDLARALGVDTTQLAATIKVAGPQGQQIPLAEVLEAHRRSPELLQAEGAIRQRAAEIERREAEFAQASQLRLQELQGALETVYTAFAREEESINWEALKIEDPVGWAVKRQEMADRQRVIEAGVAARNAELQRRQAEQQAQLRARADAEHATILAKKPEWRDPARAKTDMERIIAMLGSYGLDLAQWNNVIDHRMVLVADAAARWWEMQTKSAPLALKRVSQLPQIPRPGPRQEPVDQKQVERQRLLEGHRKTRSIESAAAVLKNILG